MNRTFVKGTANNLVELFATHGCTANRRIYDGHILDHSWSPNGTNPTLSEQPYDDMQQRASTGVEGITTKFKEQQESVVTYNCTVFLAI